MTYTYQKILKPLFFKIDPETVHERITRTGVFLGSNPLTRAMIRALYSYQHHSLRTSVAEISFENPIGLAAGFDKNARLHPLLPEVGFGFAELGSVTGERCAGNPRPRLFRVPQEKSILVNYGLCNDGAETIAKRLSTQHFRIPIGMSVAKTNDSTLTTQQGIADYQKAFRLLHPIGSYTTINVSCPNTSDGQTFGHPENLMPLLDTIAKEEHHKPVFIKIKPDMTQTQLHEIVSIVEKHEWITGFISGNLTMHREGLATSKQTLDSLCPKGGLSGLPVKERSNQTIKTLRALSEKTIIGCGGVFSGKDAYEKLALGASLIQIVTALIYEGPSVVSKINKELVDILQQKGYGSVREVTKKV